MRRIASLTAILALSACAIPPGGMNSDGTSPQASNDTSNNDVSNEWNKDWVGNSAPSSSAPTAPKPNTPKPSPIKPNTPAPSTPAPAPAPAPTEPAPSPSATGQTISVTALPGWSQTDTAQALASFVISCKALLLMPPDTALGGTGVGQQGGGQVGLWVPSCTAAEAVAPNNEAAAQTFFQNWFNAYVISNNATISGYFEPEVDGSKNEGPGFTVPLYAKPALDSLANLPRSAIDNGALYRNAPVTAYVGSRVDAFMLQIQGSGRIRLPSGQTLTVGFNGQNNQPYTPIGKLLIKMGALKPNDISYQSISNWLKANPTQADAIMEQNQNYVYLSPLGYLPAGEGAPGTLGVPLTPEHSVAIDRSSYPLGAPLFISTSNPLTGSPLNLLAVAQDTGAGLQGANQADLFFGSGTQAEAIAGHMHQPGKIYILLPRTQPQP